MRKDLLNRLFVFLASFSMLFNSLSTPLYVYAQELTPTPEPTPIETATPEPTIEATATPTEEPSSTPVETIAPEVSPTPVATDEATPSPTPEETIVPTFAPESTPTTTAPPQEEVQSVSNPNTESSATIVTTSAPTPNEPKENGHISAVVLTDTNAASIPVNDLAVNTDGSATLQTDKADYAPTDSVLVTGTGFIAGKTYTIIISSSDDPAVTHTGTVTANSEGKIIYSYQLDGNYRPNYKVEVKDESILIALTTFTDSRTINSVTVGGGSSVTVSSGATISAEVTVTTSGTGSDARWRCTDWSINTSASGFTHADHPNHDGAGGPYSETFNITAPATPGTYNAYFISYNNDSCSNGASSTFTLPNAIIVKYNTTTTITSDSPSPSDVGHSYTVNVSVTRSGGSNHPTGTVTISDGTDSCQDITDSGTGGTSTYSCSLISTTGGSKTLTATYAGDNNFSGSSGTRSHTVNVPDTTNPTVSASNSSTDWRTSIGTITLSVADSGGSGLSIAHRSWDSVADHSIGTNFTNGSTTSVPSQGDHTLYLYAEDGAGNNTSWSGSYKLDTTKPTDPTNVDSTTHTVGVSTTDNTITMAWTVAGSAPGATDALSGVDGYGYVFNNSASWTCDQVKRLNSDATSVTSGTLAAGNWYFHLCTKDVAGNWTSTVHKGPYTITSSTGPSITVTNINGHTPPFSFTCPDHPLDNPVTISGSGSGSAPPGDASQYHVLVDWGDGNTDTGLGTFTPNSGHVNFTFTFTGGPHTYTTGGAKTISVKLYHSQAPGQDNQITSTFSIDVCIYIPPTTGTLTVIKHVDNLGVGTKSASDFQINVSGTSNPSPSSFGGHESPGTSVTLSAGTYSVTEGDHTGYDVSYSSDCSGTFSPTSPKTCTVTNTYIPRCGDGHLDQGESCDDGNTNNTDACSNSCTINPGTLTFTKYTNPSSDQTKFDVNIRRVSDGVTIDTCNLGNGQSCTKPLQPGAYQFYENLGDGWRYDIGGHGNFYCTKNGVDINYESFGNKFTIAAGEQIDCSVTNTKLGHLIIQKTTVPANDLQLFHVYATNTPNVPSSISFYSNASGDINSSTSLDVYLVGGPVTVYENSVQGWKQTGQSGCEGITFVPGETKTCTFTNTKLGAVTFIKHVNGGSATAGDWSFGVYNGTGGMLADTYASGNTYNFEPGNYTVEESSKQDYTLTGASGVCSINSTNGKVEMNVTTNGGNCELTNTRDAGRITIAKVVDPGSDSGKFDLSLNDENEASNIGNGYFTDPIDVYTGNYEVKETAGTGTTLSDYQSNFECLDNANDQENIASGSGTSVNIDVHRGDNIVCTFTNTKLAKIIIKKEATPSGSGTSTTFNFHWAQLNVPPSTQFSLSEGGQYDTGFIPAGIYTVTEDVLTGWEDGHSIGSCDNGQNTNSLTLNNGDVVTCTFVNVKQGSISGTKFNDLNANGVKDAGEPGIAGWQIFSDQNGDGILNGHEPSTTTDGNGNYSFSNLRNQDYSICETEQTGWARTYPASSNCQTVTVANGADSTADFGNARLSNIHGYKWNDLNGNGIEDENETRLGGWRIFIDGNGNQTYDIGEAFTFTDSGSELGWYSFADLLPGTYSVCEEQQGGWIETSSPICHTVQLPNGPNTCSPSDQENFVVSNSVCNFGNKEVTPGIEISKSNDKAGGVGQSDIVTYTLSLENTGNVELDNITVSDVPAGGFTYVAGSTVIDGNPAGDPSISGGVLSWNISSLAAKTTTNIVYKLITAGDLAAGIYTNYATCTGGHAIFTRDSEKISLEGLGANCDPVKSTVSRGVSVGYGGSLTPQVLGASTELPATGSATWVLILAGLAGIFGVGLRIYSKKRYAKN